ncbi:hypothetical protein niasHS_010337 [Heterodera schachtii]|uniref:Uncharacterized protein n=1 Tax=Heterodera schachtii TaxID=97005 RepID=A0ABD2J657_HETSC
MHLSAIICANSAAGPSSIRIFPLLLFIVVILHRFRPVASVATRLLFSDNDDSLLQAWHELVALQAKQSAIAHRDIPWTNGFSSLCANVVVVLLLHRPGTAHHHGTTMMVLTAIMIPITMIMLIIWCRFMQPLLRFQHWHPNGWKFMPKLDI